MLNNTSNNIKWTLNKQTNKIKLILMDIDYTYTVNYNIILMQNIL